MNPNNTNTEAYKIFPDAAPGPYRVERVGISPYSGPFTWGVIRSPEATFIAIAATKGDAERVRDALNSMRPVSPVRDPAPPGLDAAALSAAEKVYWQDDGVSRHNLAAAIRAYLAVRGVRDPSPPEDGIARAVQDDLTREVLEALWNGDIQLSAEERQWIRQALDVQDRGVRGAGVVPPDTRPCAHGVPRNESCRRCADGQGLMEQFQ